MAQSKYIVGRGTEVRVAIMHECQRIIPEVFKLTVDVTPGAAAATSLSVALDLTYTPGSPPTQDVYAAADSPIYLTFTEANGREHLVEVVDIITAGATATLTTSPLLKDIPVGAVAHYPPILAARTASNLSANDQTADVMTFDNEGWQDSVTTMLGNGLELPGFYTPSDAGWNSALHARFHTKEMFFQLKLPTPGCDDTYARGHVFRLFGAVDMPLNVPADNIITADISTNSRGKVLSYLPSASLAIP